MLLEQRNNFYLFFSKFETQKIIKSFIFKLIQTELTSLLLSYKNDLLQSLVLTIQITLNAVFSVKIVGKVR